MKQSNREKSNRGQKIALLFEDKSGSIDLHEMLDEMAIYVGLSIALLPTRGDRDAAICRFAIMTTNVIDAAEDDPQKPHVEQATLQ